MAITSKNAEACGVWLTLLVIASGGIFWFAKLESKADTNTKDVEEITEQVKEDKKDMKETIKEMWKESKQQSEKLGSIDAKLSILIETIKNHGHRRDLNER